MNMKEHILAALREQFDQWEALLATLPKDQIERPQPPSRWSTKDIVAHLMAWQQLSIARVEAALADRKPVFPAWLTDLDPDPHGSPDQANDLIYKTYRDQPWTDVYQKWQAGFLRFIDLSDQVSERDLLDGSRYPWLESYALATFLLASYDHHQEHLEKLRAWLREQDDKNVAG